jgi:hypothetical protein
MNNDLNKARGGVRFQVNSVPLGNGGRVNPELGGFPGLHLSVGVKRPRNFRTVLNNVCVIKIHEPGPTNKRQGGKVNVNPGCRNGQRSRDPAPDVVLIERQPGLSDVPGIPTRVLILRLKLTLAKDRHWLSPFKVIV